MGLEDVQREAKEKQKKNYPYPDVQARPLGMAPMSASTLYHIRPNPPESLKILAFNYDYPVSPLCFSTGMWYHPWCGSRTESNKGE